MKILLLFVLLLPFCRVNGQEPARDPLIGEIVELVNGGKYKEAVESCNRALKAKVRPGDAYAYRAFSYYNLGKYDEAVADYFSCVTASYAPFGC